MASLFYNAAGQDFDDLFEPDPNGPVADNFYRADGSPLRYASLSYGSRIGDVNHYLSDGRDLASIWAGRGTVAYTVGSIGDMGSYDNIVAYAPSVDWYPAHCRTSCDFILRRNGTWQFIQYSRNFRARAVRTRSGAVGYLYPEGSVVAQGNWAQNPRGDFGDAYTVDFVQEAFEWGRVDYPGSAGQLVYQPNNTNSKVDNLTGSIEGLGTNIPLWDDRVFRGVLDQNTTANMNGQRDRNAGWSTYNRGIVRVYIKRNGATVLTFRVLFNNQNRFADIDVVTPE